MECEFHVMNAPWLDNMRGGAPGRALLTDGSFMLETYTADPANIMLTAPDGLTVAWTSGGIGYISTYFAALGAWKKVALG